MKSKRMILVSLATIGALVAPISVRAAEDEPADAVRMSLNDCLAKALDHNLDLAIVKKDPEIAYQSVLFEKATFDPLFTADRDRTRGRASCPRPVRPAAATGSAPGSIPPPRG